MKSPIFKTFFLSLCMFSVATLSHAQTASILPPAYTTFADQNGKPLVGGKVYHYIPGTTTPKTTWQDSGETIPNSQPVTLDSSGRAKILGDGSYRQIVRDKNNNLIWDANTSSTGSGGGGATATVGDGDPVGIIKSWSGFVAPSQYVFAYGQEFTRASYPELFAAISLQKNVTCTSGSPTLTSISDTTQLAIGSPIESSCLNTGATVSSKTVSTVTASSNAIISTTTTARFFPYGNGDGSFTFNIPDLRGRTLAGRDNMGGIAASRLTSTYFGANASATGASGGDESKTLSITQMPSHNHGGVTGPMNANNPHTHSVSGGAVGGTTYANITASGSVNVPSNAVNIGINSADISHGHSITAEGGGQAHSVVQPTITTNYIIKTIPDTNPNSYFGVASIGGMYGVINCGFGITCAGNEISAVTSTVPTPTPTTLGGVFQQTALSNQFVTGVDINGNFTFSGGATTVNGQTCAIGGTCTISASASTVTVGTTNVAGGTNTRLLYNNAGVLGEYSSLPLSLGGCNASLTASNGGILWSNATQCQILAGTATARLPLLSGSSAIPVWGNYTLPTSVTSGGIPYFSSTSSESSSGLLTANAVMIGGGAGAAPSTLASLGTTTTLLHGNASGAPTFGAVVSADMNITATNCINQFVSAISTGGIGTCTTVPNGSLSQAGAVTLKGNPTSSTANVQDFTISGLTQSTTPNTSSDMLLIWDSAAGIFKKINPATIASSATAGVSSIAGNTGAFTLNTTSGITNSINDILCSAGSSSQFGCVKVDDVTLRASAGVVSLKSTAVTNSLSANVSMSVQNAYYDGPSIAQGTTGVWFASGSVLLTDTVGSGAFFCKLWDGTTVIASGGTNGLALAGGRSQLALSGYISSPAANIRISCSNATTATGVINFNSTGNGKDSTLSAFRIQ